MARIQLTTFMFFLLTWSSVRSWFLNERYEVNWTIDEAAKSIRFDLTVQTKGYVGFGLSPNATMPGADIVICRVFDDGNAIVDDRYGLGFFSPSIDDQQDYTLISASENETHTNCSFSRPFDTADEHDYFFDEVNLVALIWAIGDTDDLGYHNQTRGAEYVTIWTVGGHAEGKN